MPSKSLVPAAYVILRRDEQALLQLRKNTGYMDGYWATAAAGHVEAGESVFETAIRESKEELGVSVAIEDLVPVCAMHRAQEHNEHSGNRVDFFFSCTRWQGTPHIAEPNKVADLRWFDLADLPPKVVPHEHFVLDKLQSDQLAGIATFGF